MKTHTPLIVIWIHFIVSSTSQLPRRLNSGRQVFDYAIGSPDYTYVKGLSTLFMDYENTEASVISDLKAKGVRIICYVSVGTYEDYRGDKNEFLKANRRVNGDLIGKAMKDWPREKWLNIKRVNDLIPLMKTRFEMAKKKGCEGIDPDNVDAYTQGKSVTGFDLTEAQQKEYNIAIAKEAHRQQLLVGLKNDPGQASYLATEFDFSVVESCSQYNECGKYAAFISQDKPIFAIEYDNFYNSETFESSVCQKQPKTYSFILQNKELVDVYEKMCALQ